jgi:L-lactate dehydrogenase complex protein LldG
MLARIRVALGRTAPLHQAPTPPAVPDGLVRLASRDDDLPALFSRRAEEVGMEVLPCGDGDVSAVVVPLLRSAGARRVVCGVASLENALCETGMELVEWRRDPSMARVYDADAAVTDVHAALAETGTLVCCADAGHSRGSTLVPPLHVAIVRHRDIVPDMLDWARRAPGRVSSSTVFITGPSKTADIEGVLVRGVHGPRRVVIVLVADPPNSPAATDP